MFAPGRPFQPSLIFVGKARSLPESGAPEEAPGFKLEKVCLFTQPRLIF